MTSVTSRVAGMGILYVTDTWQFDTWCSNMPLFEYNVKSKAFLALQWRHNGCDASQITSLTSVYSTIYSGADQRKHQSSTSLAFLWGNHRWPVNSLHKWPVTRKMFPFDDVIMVRRIQDRWSISSLLEINGRWHYSFALADGNTIMPDFWYDEMPRDSI